jgi:hypothetical protein
MNLPEEILERLKDPGIGWESLQTMTQVLPSSEERKMKEGRKVLGCAQF